MSFSLGQSQGCKLDRRHSSFLCTLLFVGWQNAALSNAVRITSTGPQTIPVAQNDDVQIGCTFELSPSDTGFLDIEWSIMSPDTTKQDLIILTFVHDQVFEYPSTLKGRFRFVDRDPSQGIASVRVSSLTTSDTNTFQCKVKKTPGIDTRKVTVGVQDGGSGTLLIKNSTDGSYGTYRCSVRNLVGQEECLVILTAAAAGRSKTGMIVGAVLGVLLALLLLLLLLWLLCCCCRRRRQDKDYPHDIREDAPPPVSRSPSMGSVRSIRSYKAHQARKPQNVTFYSAVRKEDSTRTSTPDQPPVPHRTPDVSLGRSRLDFVV